MTIESWIYPNDSLGRKASYTRPTTILSRVISRSFSLDPELVSLKALEETTAGMPAAFLRRPSGQLPIPGLSIRTFTPPASARTGAVGRPAQALSFFAQLPVLVPRSLTLVRRHQ